jgi:hypothetical protein
LYTSISAEHLARAVATSHPLMAPARLDGD